MTAEKIVDELTYRSYRHNRVRAPGISPERWEMVYGAATAALEARFQGEAR